MRCPYCGGLNRDQSTFCVNCGRDMRDSASRPPRPAPQQQPARPTSYAPPQQPPARSNTQQRSTVATPAWTERPQQVPVQTPRVPPPPAAEPEPPVLFPPRTMEQFEALLTTGAQEYTVGESTVSDGKKKIISITYSRCAAWQQAATLFKAFKELQEKQFDIIIIQGTIARQQSTYGYTNGQLQFNRNTRLGAKLNNRYVVETGNGFASDAVRFVLNE